MLIYSSDAYGDLTTQAPGTLAAPQIVGQPVDQLVGAGDFASFTVVVANASGVTFQWAFNGTDISGASGDSLLLPAVTAADVGQYSVTVTNSAGSVTSSPATLALDSTGSSWIHFIGRFSSARDSLLSFQSVSGEWILAELKAGRFAHRVVGNTAGLGQNFNNGRFWIGDFTGAGRSQVLCYSPGDGNWGLGTVDAAGMLQWSLIGNTGHDINEGGLFWIGDFTGAGDSQALFYDPFDDDWRLISVDSAGNLQWPVIGNTAGFGHMNDGRPFWVGDFTDGGHRSQVLFYYSGNDQWILGSVGTAGNLQWSLVATFAGYQRSVWVGDFTGVGHSQLLASYMVWYPDDNWWLGSADAAGNLQWSLVGNTAGFGHIIDGRPFWVGDFTDAGHRSQLLFYTPGDHNWRLGSMNAAGQLQWSLAGNTAGFGRLNDGRPFWIGDFTGAGRSQVLFYYPGDFNWWLGSVDAAGKLQWSLVDNSAG
jgi:hypothetical protein